MINSLRAALIALVSLAVTPTLYAAQPEADAQQESVALEETPHEEVPLHEAAEGVATSPPTPEASPAAVQLPFDLKAAADIALAAFGGEILKAEQVEAETGIQFNIRIVNNGRVRDVVVDAANGEIIKPLETEVVDAVTAADEPASAAEQEASVGTRAASTATPSDTTEVPAQ